MKREERSNSSEKKGRESLFRQEVIEHKKGSFLGNVSVICPIAYRYWVGGIALIAVLLLIFFIFGGYSKHHQARGVLLPNKGLILVYPNSAGVVIERFVKQGDKVKKNQPLYRISTEVHDSGQLSLARQQIATLEQQLVLAKNRAGSARDHLNKYQQLYEEKYVSQGEYQGAYDFYMEREIEQKSIEQQLIHAKSSLEHTVIAAEDGLVSNVIAVPGDRVTMDKALCTIIPEGAVLEGNMFVHSRDIGFVRVGQTILLKYDAYPYQNFGLYKGTIVNIAESSLSQKEYDFPVLPNADNPYIMDSYYRVIVKLDKQTVKAYGKLSNLNAGMTFIGEIIGEKRKIWQWILEPIYTLRGSLISHE